MNKFFATASKPVPPPTTAADAMLRVIIENNLPFRILSSGSMQEFWNKFLPAQVKLTRQDAAGARLSGLYADVISSISVDIKACEYLALTTDGWTGLRSSFWSLTAHGFDADFRLHHSKLGCLPIVAPVYSGPVLASELKKALESYQLDEKKVCAIVTDEGERLLALPRNFRTRQRSTARRTSQTRYKERL
jgi:hypothetical protein